MENILKNILTGFSLTDVIDILIVAFIIYKLLGFIRDSRAEQLVKGILFLVILFFLSDLLNLYTLHWLLKSTLALGVVALVVVFQPELRRALEYVGRSKIMRGPISIMDTDKAKKLVDEFVRAIAGFSQSRTGALIIFERETSLSDIVETGTIIDANITSQLLGNMFYEGAPLHDGAVIIREDKLHAAGCVLPLTENKELNKALGTRHRAGIGITENSDAISIIVSEETGVISMAVDGVLTRFLDVKAIEKILLNFYMGKLDENTSKFSVIGKIGKKMGGGKHAEK